MAIVIGGIGAQDRDGIEALAAIRAIDATAVRDELSNMLSTSEPAGG